MIPRCYGSPMHAKRPSQTSAMVAMLRALAHDGVTTAHAFRDPVAEQLLPRRWSVALALARRAMRRAAPAVRHRVALQIDPVPLRALEIDAELCDAVAAGCRQVVLLGAGLDARAYRLAALETTTVFEVDHPQTQDDKRRRTSRLHPLAERLVHVPVDFERDDLADRLRLAGHRADVPTAWVWEGVVMYLTDAALRASLRAISSLCAPGSVLVLHYHEPDTTGPEFHGQRLLLSLWREPQIGRRTRTTVADELRAAGLAVVRDSGHDEWATRFGAGPAASGLARVSRIALARVAP